MMFVSRRTHDHIVHTLTRQIGDQQRIIDGLVDRIMYSRGQTWTPPPVLMNDEREPVDEPEQEWTTFDPGQLL